MAHELDFFGEDWDEHLKWTHAFEILQVGSLARARKLVRSFAERDIAIDEILTIASWYRSHTKSEIYLFKLNMLIDLGYRNHFDLDLLSCPDLSVLLSYGTIPSKEYLGSKPSRLGKFVSYSNVLWKLYSDLESPRADDVMSLMQTGVNPNFLENLARDMHDPEVKSEVLRGLDKNLCNIKGESFYEMFSRTISSLSSLRLKISTQNISNYWSLTEELILHIVDQGLEGDRVREIARLVSNPIELSAWLATEPGDFGVEEIMEWIRHGFCAEEAEKWCKSQFDAATSSKWRNVTESPIAARRRVEAGIRPPR